jgi:UDP-glucose 4-epimerase
MSRKKILITGVNGFLGSWIAHRLMYQHQVIGIGRSHKAEVHLSMDYYQMDLPSSGLVNLLAATRPDVVIHCAGGASVPFSIANPEDDFRNGPGLVTHLLEALGKNRQTPTIIFPSSAAVYGNPQRLPIAEEEPLNPISPYGRHKVLSESLLHEASQNKGIPYIIMRIFSGYGAGLRKQLLWDAAGKIMSGNLELHGTGQESRDFIHAWDVARFAGLCIEDDVRNLTINVARGEGVTVRELVDKLISCLKVCAQPHFTGSARNGDPLHWRADVSRLASLGFFPVVSLEQGLAHFSSWFIEEIRSKKRKFIDIPNCWMLDKK